MSTEIITVTD